MSYVLETLNRGYVEDCGFVFGDIECVRLGALPAIPVSQFVEYSTETILEILSSENLDSKLKEQLQIEIAFNCGRVTQATVQETSRSLKRRADIDDEIARQVVKTMTPNLAGEFGNPARNYVKNPFVFQNGQVNISNIYEVSVPEFVIFASRQIGGGTFGWNPNIIRIPKEVKENSLRLLQAITASETS